MCVIICAEKEFPSLAILKRAEIINPHGGGIAWIEDGKIAWKKGLTAEQVHEITKSIRPPAIIHFRIATVGAKVPELCHPFPMNAGAATVTSGKSNAVLFHNGSWKSWLEHAKSYEKRGRHRMPKGHWSDSRAMAWLAGIYGEPFLEMVKSQRIATLSPKNGISRYGQWMGYENMHCSNIIGLGSDEGAVMLAKNRRRKKRGGKKARRLAKRMGRRS